MGCSWFLYKAKFLCHLLAKYGIEKRKNGAGGRVYIFGGRSERREQIVLYYTSVFDFCDCVAVGSLEMGKIVGFSCLRLCKLRIWLFGNRHWNPHRDFGFFAFIILIWRQWDFTGFCWSFLGRDQKNRRICIICPISEKIECFLIFGYFGENFCWICINALKNRFAPVKFRVGHYEKSLIFFHENEAFRCFF